ncbi:MAG: FAD-dependent oxidoreductase [Calothrix sp. MO_167.B12]|nr:FAD-dependent oxidoreductase [Calothrix sp. MO_167.B12]
MKIAIAGCGIVGATIAYELSQVPGLNITVLDKLPPPTLPNLPSIGFVFPGSTGAALGVLMGIISHKAKGKAWRLRQASVQRYETLLPELESITGRSIPCNRQGILHLCLPEENLDKWESLTEIRHSQGFPLEIWDIHRLQQFCPQVSNNNGITGAIYSPQDRQIDPTALTMALVDAAKHNGVEFKFGVNVLGVTPPPSGIEQRCEAIETSEGRFTVDCLVIAAGLGSSPFTAQLKQFVDIRPVLGQALQLRLADPLGNPDFQPVISGNDVHIVPVGDGDYWVGATVEFPSEDSHEIPSQPELLQGILEQAIAFCPQLATATTIRTWSGLRPRPEGRPAPIIDKLPGFSNIFLATGHYRNGVLLAPATAIAIREMIVSN